MSVIEREKAFIFLGLNLAFFRCHVCDYTVEVDNDRGVINEPTRCERPECNSKNSMMLIHNRCEFSDKQICRLQETPGKFVH